MNMNKVSSLIHNLASNYEIKVYHLEKTTIFFFQKYYKKEANASFAFREKKVKNN